MIRQVDRIENTSVPGFGLREQGMTLFSIASAMKNRSQNRDWLSKRDRKPLKCPSGRVAVTVLSADNQLDD